MPAGTVGDCGFVENQNEVCWVKLANDNILTTILALKLGALRAVLNTWIVDNTRSGQVYGYGAEIGAGFCYQRMSFISGGSTNNRIYTPGPT